MLIATPLSRARRLVRHLCGDESSPLAGRTVMITGASSGIGEATAYAVGEAGAEVLLVARRADELARVADQIRSAGGTAYTYTCDLTDLEAIDALVAQVLAEHVGVDYLVNNAGRSIRRSLELSYDRFHDFERTMQINYFGPVRLTMGLLPTMRAQGFGHVVNIVTWGNQIKAPKFAAYIASKQALDSFARIAGRETWHDNVSFTNVRVSLVRTPMVAPTKAYDGRGKTPEQAARTVLHALEDRPVTVNTVAGSTVEWLNILAPRLTDFAVAQVNKRLPDSPAARGAN